MITVARLDDEKYVDQEDRIWAKGVPFHDDECCNCDRDMSRDAVAYWRPESGGVYCYQCVAEDPETWEYSIHSDWISAAL